MSRRDTPLLAGLAGLAALGMLGACTDDRFLHGSCESTSYRCSELRGEMTRAEVQLERDQCTGVWRDETACHIDDVEFGCRRDLTGDEGDYTITTWHGPNVFLPWTEPPTEDDFRLRCFDSSDGEYVPAPPE